MCFDLSVLYAGGYINRQMIQSALSDEEKTKACDCILSLGFNEFAGQVIEFLPEPERTQYGSPAAWAALQEDVLALFGG